MTKNIRNSMSPILLKSYRIEYETTSITLPEILKKYKLKEEQTEKWVKQQNSTPPIIVPRSDIDAQPGTSTTLVSKDFDKDKLLEDISQFKVEAVKYAVDTIKDSEFLEVKEFKDLVAIVATVETSLKDNKDTGPTINILVQQLTEKFRDDC